jgi:hypothetical protein
MIIVMKECSSFTKKLDQDSMIFALEPNASIQITLCFKALRSAIKTNNEGQIILKSVVSGTHIDS